MVVFAAPTSFAVFFGLVMVVMAVTASAPFFSVVMAVTTPGVIKTVAASCAFYDAVAACAIFFSLISVFA